MDSAQNCYVYNPLQQKKALGRRTGKPIYKKRNVHNALDSFNDYLSGSDDDRSINVTKHTPLSATENTESSHKQKGTTAAAQKSTETKGGCEVTAENKRENISLIYTHQPLPEEFVNMRIVNPLAAGSRFGRRTGKDILAGKISKIVASNVKNFSDFFSDSDVSVSVQATPSHLSEQGSSPSTSAKESDVDSSPRKNTSGDVYKQKPHFTILAENSASCHSPMAADLTESSSGALSKCGMMSHSFQHQGTQAILESPREKVKSSDASTSTEVSHGLAVHESPGEKVKSSDVSTSTEVNCGQPVYKPPREKTKSSDASTSTKVSHGPPIHEYPGEKVKSSDASTSTKVSHGPPIHEYPGEKVKSSDASTSTEVSYGPPIHEYPGEKVKSSDASTSTKVSHGPLIHEYPGEKVKSSDASTSTKVSHGPPIHEYPGEKVKSSDASTSTKVSHGPPIHEYPGEKVKSSDASTSTEVSYGPPIHEYPGEKVKSSDASTSTKVSHGPLIHEYPGEKVKSSDASTSTKVSHGPPIHEYPGEKVKSSDVSASTRVNYGLVVHETRYTEQVIEKTNSTIERLEGLQEDFVNKKDISLFGNRISSDISLPAKSLENNEQGRLSGALQPCLQTSVIQNPFISKHTSRGQVSDTVSNNDRNINSSNRKRTKINQRKLREGFSEKADQRKSAIMVSAEEKCQPHPYSDQFDSVGGESAKVIHSTVMGNIDIEGCNIDGCTDGRLDRLRDVSKAQTKQSTQTALISVMNSKSSGSDKELSDKLKQSSEYAAGQTGTQKNLAESAEVELDFGGDVIGSVSKYEKKATCEFFGIKKRLSYSDTVLQQEQREGDRRSSETKEQIGRGSAETKEQIGRGSAETKEQIGRGSAETKEQIGRGSAETKEQISRGSAETKEQIGRGSAETKEQIGRGSAEAKEQIGRGSAETKEQPEGRKQTVKHGSFLEHHSEIGTRSSNTNRRTGSLVTYGPRRVGSPESGEKCGKSLSILNMSTDSLDDFFIVENRPTVQLDLSRNNKKKGKKMEVADIVSGKKFMHSEKGSTANQVKKNRGKRKTDPDVYKHLDTVLEMSTLLTLVPEAVSQLVNKEKSCLNVSMNSLNGLCGVEEMGTSVDSGNDTKKKRSIVNEGTARLPEQRSQKRLVKKNSRKRKMDSDFHEDFGTVPKISTRLTPSAPAEPHLANEEKLHARLDADTSSSNVLQIMEDVIGKTELPSTGNNSIKMQMRNIGKEKKIKKPGKVSLVKHVKKGKRKMDTSISKKLSRASRLRELSLDTLDAVTVSQALITDKQGEQDLNTNGSSSSLDNLGTMEGKLEELKCLSGEKNERTQEIDSADGRRISYPQQDSPSKLPKHDIEMGQVDEEVLNIPVSNIRTMKSQQKKGSKRKKKHETRSHIEPVCVSDSNGELAMVQSHSLQASDKPSFPVKQNKTEEKLSDQPSLKMKVTVSVLRRSIRISRNLNQEQSDSPCVQDKAAQLLKSFMEADIEGQSSPPGSVLSKQDAEMVSGSFVSPSKKCKKVSSNAKKVLKKHKLKKPTQKTINQSRRQVKTLKTRARKKSMDKAKKNPDSADGSTEVNHEISHDLRLNSNEMPASHMDIIEEQIDRHSHEAEYVDLSRTVPNAVTNKAQEKACTKSPEKSMQELGESSIEELYNKYIGSAVAEVPVPVKLSSVKRKKSSRQSAASGRKRRSFKALSSKRNEDRHGVSSPVRLNLISSLPNVTPRSGISFRHSRRFTRTNLGDEKNSPFRVPESSPLTAQDEPYTTPRRKHQNVPTVLSSCLKNSQSVKPRRKPLKVRISNHIDWNEQPPVENDSACSPKDDTSLLSPNCSPVHYAETTTSAVFCKPKAPQIVLPDLSYKIVRPEGNSAQGLRRSARTRVQRLKSFKGEGIIYRRDSSGFGLVVDGIQPSLGEARVKALEEERRRRLRDRKMKAMMVPAKPPKRLSTHWKVNHSPAKHTRFPVINPDNNEQVLLELVAHHDSLTWCGPDLESVTGTEPVAICILLRQPAFTTGEMHMRALAEKPCQLTEGTTIFAVLYGKVLLTINDVSSVVETGGNFFVPRGTRYYIKNLRREIARLHFTCIEDSYNESSHKLM